MPEQHHTGGCLCGAVRYEVRGALRDVIACHCRECRRVSSHHVAATAARPGDWTITKSDGLGWYSVGGVLRRGFCRDCGATLFFDHGPEHPLGIGAGSLDVDPGLRIAVHIYVDEAGRYYELPDDGAPRMDSQSWRKVLWDKLRWVGGPG